MDTIASRYAESLFALAKEEKAVETYSKDIEKVENVFQDDVFVQFFSHVAVQDDEKIKILKESFQNQISEYVLNFLLLLVKKRRIRYIRFICQNFQKLCNDYLGIKEGTVYSAYTLKQEEIKKIEDAMSHKMKKKVQLHMVIDETLIGGIRVEIDNHVYDDTLSYKLESLRKELLRK